MARISIRDVPDEVYDVLVKGAQQNHQSLNAFVLDRLAESAKVIDMAAYVALAEQLEVLLLTCDAKLAASGGRCQFEVIGRRLPGAAAPRDSRA